MTKNKYKRMFIIFICALFVVISIISSVMINNHLHIENCDIDECPVCFIIHFSTEIMYNIVLISTKIQIIGLAILVTKFIKGNNKQKIEITLVDLKIIQNN